LSLRFYFFSLAFATQGSPIIVTCRHQCWPAFSCSTQRATGAPRTLLPAVFPEICRSRLTVPRCCALFFSRTFPLMLNFPVVIGPLWTLFAIALPWLVSRVSCRPAIRVARPFLWFLMTEDRFGEEAPLTPTPFFTPPRSGLLRMRELPLLEPCSGVTFPPPDGPLYRIFYRAFCLMPDAFATLSLRIFVTWTSPKTQQ